MYIGTMGRVTSLNPEVRRSDRISPGKRKEKTGSGLLKNKI